jgi:hypothetical protein
MTTHIHIHDRKTRDRKYTKGQTVRGKQGSAKVLGYWNGNVVLEGGGGDLMVYTENEVEELYGG